MIACPRIRRKSTTWELLPVNKEAGVCFSSRQRSGSFGLAAMVFQSRPVFLWSAAAPLAVLKTKLRAGSPASVM